jgi:ferredoxin
MTQLGFVLDQRKCIGCHACTVACKVEHGVELGVFRTWVKYVEEGTFPDSRRNFSVMRCNQCTDAPCVSICPVKSLYKREHGIVDFDPDRCIGCKAGAAPGSALLQPASHGLRGDRSQLGDRDRNRGHRQGELDPRHLPRRARPPAGADALVAAGARRHRARDRRVRRRRSGPRWSDGGTATHHEPRAAVLARPRGAGRARAGAELAGEHRRGRRQPLDLPRRRRADR